MEGCSPAPRTKKGEELGLKQARSEELRVPPHQDHLHGLRQTIILEEWSHSRASSLHYSTQTAKSEKEGMSWPISGRELCTWMYQENKRKDLAEGVFQGHHQPLCVCVQALGFSVPLRLQSPGELITPRKLRQPEKAKRDASLHKCQPSLTLHVA